VPEIARFFGIVIRMFFTDHPVPHFHATYRSTSARIGITPVLVIESDLPPRILRLALRWASLHEHELAANWRLLRAGRPPKPIEPLR